MRKEAIGNENQNFKKRRYQELKGKGSMYFLHDRLFLQL